MTEELRTENDALREQIMWYHAALSILIELEGGAVRIEREVLEDYDLRGTIRLTKDEQADMYTLEVVSE